MAAKACQQRFNVFKSIPGTRKEKVGIVTLYGWGETKYGPI